MEISREPKQACHACKEPIQKDASKCPHCGSEQERFTWSSIGLAGGAALSVISLCTLAGGTAWSWIEAKQASLIGAVAQVDQTGVYFSLSNTGNRAATIMQGSVKGKFAEGSCKGIAQFEDTLQTASIFSVIEPGKTNEFKVKFQGEQQYMTGTIVAPGLANAERNPDIERYKTCELTVVYVDFDTSFQSTTIPFACLIQADCSVDPSMGQRK